MEEARRRGNAIVVGLLFTTLLGFAALSVDLGVIRVSQTQLQAGIDAAALSGSMYLDGTDVGIDLARAKTVDMAARNRVLGQPIALAAGDVEFGIVDENGVLTMVADPYADVDLVNVLRVTHEAPDAAAALGTAAFGVAGYDLAASSTAARRTRQQAASSTACFLPFAIPDCHLAGLAPGTNPGPMVFSFAPSTTDSIAWGDPDANPNSSALRDQLAGTCTGGTIEIGDPIYVNEGQHNSATKLVADILNDQAAIAPDTWDASLYGPIPARGSHPTHPGTSVSQLHYGNVLQGPVALVDAGADCSNVSFTQSKVMTGVAWAVIYDVRDSGGDKHLKFQLDVVHPHQIWGETDEDATGPNVFGYEPPTLLGG